MPEDWTQLFHTSTTEDPIERIVYLWNLDAPAELAAGDAVMGTDALLHLAQALETTMAASKVRIDAITRGAQPVGRPAAATTIGQAPAVGLFRVILNEYSNLACHGIDLPPSASVADAALLWGRMLASELVGISQHDFPSFIAVGLALSAVVILASIGPAWRALRIAPTVALRYE